MWIAHTYATRISRHGSAPLGYQNFFFFSSVYRHYSFPSSSTNSTKIDSAFFSVGHFVFSPPPLNRRLQLVSQSTPPFFLCYQAPGCAEAPVEEQAT
mmetsp:Transcript_51865/g.104074  ORF Transcript_51865/g.104074 Transcript_51865/m.104074 type:complete len:97 (+) Transcript_51865:151-441(+)